MGKSWFFTASQLTSELVIQLMLKIGMTMIRRQRLDCDGIQKRSKPHECNERLKNNKNNSKNKNDLQLCRKWKLILVKILFRKPSNYLDPQIQAVTPNHLLKLWRENCKTCSSPKRKFSRAISWASHMKSWQAGTAGGGPYVL